MASILENVKTLLSLKDNEQDKLLEVIISNTQSRLLGLLPPEYTEVPARLNYIVEDVSVKRYNRVGAEGMSAESVDGRSSTYQANDFDEYLDDIERLFPDESKNKKGLGVFY